MANCAIATCSNHYRKTRGLSVQVMYHRFPKGSDICKLWILKCKRQDAFNYKNVYVCSEHFSSDNDQDDMKNRLLGLPQKKILKPTATPSLNLPGSIEDPNKIKLSQDRNERLNIRRIRGEALERVQGLNPKKARVEIETHSNDNVDLEAKVMSLAELNIVK